MKTVETIKKAVNKIYKTYSLLMDKILDLIFGPEKVHSPQIVHCSGKYVITSGGCIINLDE